ncbi:MAG: hypothetical protein O3B86_10455 [Planctomycetota bacterium]|nr:hypothetical protein [Planctomycetota bacterium]
MTLDEVIERLDKWSGELEHWLHIWRKRNAVFYRRLPKIESQIRHLLDVANEHVPEDRYAEYGFRKSRLLARYHELLARCLSNAYEWEKDTEAVKEFKVAMSLAPEDASFWYSYVRHLMQKGQIFQALNEINSVDARIIEKKDDFLAQQIINWALWHSEIAFGIRADIMKHCIALVSHVGTGLLVRGCPRPHPPEHKWEHSEILRILWAGMQCSVPVDELCQREGIDEVTYWRWWNRYLPEEWGGVPALV